MLMRVQAFTNLLNELGLEARVIIYNIFFKNCYNVLLAQAEYVFKQNGAV